LIKELRSQLATLIRMEPNTADQNPRTSKPEMMPETIISRSAFMTNVKRPKLSIFIGRVKKMRIGRKKAFSIPSMAAANTAVKKLLTCIPSSK
jgi:hypothetical protein